MSQTLLAIDQGTTSSRAIAFSAEGAILASSQYPFTQHYPQDGWVEHAPEDIWQTTLQACKDVLQKIPGDCSAIGITNQRETTLLWDRRTGEPIYNAIVWQDRRTAQQCEQLRQQHKSQQISDKTGLVLDPYFSATKIAWILDHVDGARARAQRGELAFGTVDSYLIWKLTAGKVHATDATNASRTMAFNIHTQQWDEELLELFDIPASLLPEVKDSSDDFGLTSAAVLNVSIPIGGVAGDQHAALFGQACYQPGMVKSTYGTGCFMMMNTGKQAVRSTHKLLTTVAYRLNGETTYALEGSIFNAGTAIQWLRDELGLIKHVNEIDALLQQTKDNHGVVMVPAFTGLGAPHWDPAVRGGIFGLTRDTGKAQLLRAALESVGYQTQDLMEAMLADSPAPLKMLKVDGGMVVNDWLMQFLADMTQTQIQRPAVIETTALGAAYLAGLQTGLIASLSQITDQWQIEKTFHSVMQKQERDKLLKRWEQALKAVKSY